MEAAGRQQWDAVVIGGGITGAGILRECTRLGIRAILLEKHDFAWGTSSKSSKMVHGGLRYLASGQIGLTRDAVHERQRLLSELAGLVEPLTFIMGHYAGEFPPAFLFNGLLSVYDSLAGQRLHHRYDPQELPFWAASMKPADLKAFTCFQDAITDDARLTFRVIQQACREGASALNYCAVEEVLRHSNGQVSGVRFVDRVGGDTFTIEADTVFNATGAWASALQAGTNEKTRLRPLRGSHLVFPAWRLPVALSISYLHPQDKRPVFVFPWEGVTVAGTTDLDHSLHPENDIAITEEEVRYLLDGLNHILPSARLTAADVISTWAGVRPVISRGKGTKPSAEKREHSIWNDKGLVTVAGGKLTTFRLIARDAIKVAAPFINCSEKPLSATTAEVFHASVDVTDRYPTAQQRRWFGRYGEEGARFIRAQPGKRIAATPYWLGELNWILRHEVVQHLDDLMLRRTRLGNILPDGGQKILSQIAPLCQSCLGWNNSRWRRECERYKTIFGRYFSLPGNVH
jgi:glycerol-3-phosphate dehydrogenase